LTKRTRGSQRAHHRPGTRPASPARGAAGARPRAVATPPDSQLAASAEIAEDVVARRPSAAADELRAVARSTPARARAKPGSLLAARAASEYVYVAQDLRRIAIVAVLLFGILFLLWVVRFVL
jgi:hypothetical protein